jgi:outer membrane protein TolC
MIPLLLTTSLLAACAVGPDYKAPKTAAVAAAPFVGAANPAFTRDAVQDRWWTLYNDPVLTRMVEDALAANTDIRVAAARVERARAMLRNAKAARLPTTSIDASAQRDRFSSVQFGTSSAAREAWYYDGGLSLSYEVDLFGRVRRGWRRPMAMPMPQRPMPMACGWPWWPIRCAPIWTSPPAPSG